MNIVEALPLLTQRKHLQEAEMQSIIIDIMSGNIADAQMAGFLIALAMKGETVDEITGAAKAMRQLAAPVTLSAPHLVDTCGTGGSGINLFNVSTCSAFVAAAAGATVCKHGNRFISSKSGSADLLEAAGAQIQLTPEQVAECTTQTQVGFMFAPLFHSAMKHAIGVRKSLGVRTIFNILGPLTNPANVPNQVLGVFERNLLNPMAEVLLRLNSQHVLIVHSQEGLCEISSAGPTLVTELNHHEICEYEIDPTLFGLKPVPLDNLLVQNTEDSLAIVKATLAGQGDGVNIVALNAGAALYAAGVAQDFGSGVELALQAIHNGTAKGKFIEFIAYTKKITETAKS